MSTLKKIDKQSVEGVESSLNIFDLPYSNVAINKSSIRELLPLATITQEGPYIFRLFSDNQFIDLGKTWLYLELSLEKMNAAGNWINIERHVAAVAGQAGPPAIAAVQGVAGDPHVGVVQSIGQSFIKTLKISLNNIECFDSGVLYAYRSYILQELGLSPEVKAGLYQAQGYHRDGDDQNVQNNPGFEKRVRAFENGYVFKSMAKLSFDLGQQENLILNNSDIIFTIYRNNDAFLTHVIDPANNTNYRVRVHNVRLFVKTVDVTQSLNNAISRHLEKSSAKYAMRKIDVRSTFVGVGHVDFAYNIFSSVIPRRMIIGFVAADAFAGNRRLSPFVFQNANVQKISVEANGNVYPSTPYWFDFQGGHYVRAFVDMYSGLGLDEGEKTCGISMYRFKQQWCFFVIPMTASLEDTSGFELIKNGTTTIKVTFSVPVANPGWEMIVLGEFDQVLTIDRDRVPTTDGAV